MKKVDTGWQGGEGGLKKAKIGWINCERSLNAKALKHQCTLYIAKRYQTISQLKLWTETFQEDPEIVSDVLNVLAEQGDNWNEKCSFCLSLW